MECDVAIVGSGFAGLAAGIESLRAGASVTIVEKRRHTGGNSRISDGVVAAAATVEQGRARIDDSAELLLADMLVAGLGRNDRRWAELVAAESSAAFRWLVDDLGCEFRPALHRFGGHSRARCLEAVGGGKRLVGRLETVYRDLGGELLTRHRVTCLITGADGSVIGLEVADDTVDPPIVNSLLARRGVVIASGGFAGDTEFRQRYDPRLDTSIATTNLPATTAETIEAAVAVGATTRDLEWIQLGPWTSPDERAYGLAPIFTSFTAFPYGIIVDASTGRRFVSELADRRAQADAMLARGQPSLAIAGADAVQASHQSADRALRAGCVKSFESVEPLADHYGTDASGLAATICDYNAAVARGCDEAFGKPILEGTPPLQAPFLVARVWPKTHFTMGGLVIDDMTRALDAGGAPIANLHAAGEATGGTHGACRLSSMAITECIVQGRRAGRAAASV